MHGSHIVPLLFAFELAVTVIHLFILVALLVDTLTAGLGGLVLGVSGLCGGLKLVFLRILHVLREHWAHAWMHTEWVVLA